ncbi:MAG: hypothetical protein WA777_20055 [Rhodanobacter sp.]
MTHPAYTMARLNAKNARFDIGSGGVSELTQQDIAAALAFVPAGLGRELLCRMWWPDGAQLTARQLADEMEAIQRAEWSTRETAMLDALLAVASHTGGDSMRHAQRLYAAAHAARWPKWVVSAETGMHNPVYAAMRRCVVLELIEPKHCPACGGRGLTITSAGPRDCERCESAGTVAYGNTRRARHLGIIESSYRQHWDAPYLWLLTHASDAVQAASRAMEKATA